MADLILLGIGSAQTDLTVFVTSGLESGTASAALTEAWTLRERPSEFNLRERPSTWTLKDEAR